MRHRHGLTAFVLAAIGGAALAFGAPLVAFDRPTSGHDKAHAPAAAHSAPEAADPAHEAHGSRWSPFHQVEPQAHRHEAEPGTIAAPTIAFQGCAYFEDAGYGGRSGEVRDAGNVEWVGRQLDRRISSVACHPGCRMLGYPAINFGGARRVFVGGTAAIEPSWDNQIRSLRAICTAPGAH